ncbi:MAG: insulinase family protein [Alphaproteobacteria bacterium]|nr:insulinase family protein [Alphaproteobacteria bacterium]
MRPLPRVPRALVAGALLAGLAAGPAAAKVFEPETFMLANGMQVVVASNHRVPVVTHMVWYKVGSADEVPGKSGIAHFLEHLMFKGTKSVPPGEFSKIVARNGGQDNAFTSYDYTGYFQNVAKDRLELVMKLEADRMANLVLTDAEVDPERKVILEERRQTLDNKPASRLNEQMIAAQFMNHPYGRSVIGWEHEMRGLTTEDAVAWHRRYYAPNNAILVVGGDITAAELKPLAEKYYGAVPARPVPPRVRVQEPTHQAARRVVLESEQVRQPSWRRTYLAPSYARGAVEHAYPLQVLAEILGGGATGRLYKSLVLPGVLAVGASAYYDASAIDLTTFNVAASPKIGVEVEKVEAAVDKVLAEILEKGVTQEELDNARRRLQDAAILGRDSFNGGARTLGAALAMGRTVEDVETWPDRIGAVTVEQVNAAARHVLVERQSVTGILRPKPTS